MFESGKLLLATIIFTALYTTVTMGAVKLLETAPGTEVEVQTGCREQAMEKLVHSGLLEQELNKSEGFQKAWQKGLKCSAMIKGGTKNHTAALSAFHNADSVFKEMLNNEVEAMGVNVSLYEDHFHYKSLYFLLMDSFTLLKPKECKRAFLLQDKLELPKVGSTVRFPSFVTADVDHKNLEEPSDGGFILDITSCFYASLGKNICEDNIGEVLLSPSEYFTVENITINKDEDYKYTEVTLKHSSLNSNHDCFMFSRSAAVLSTQALPPLLMVSWLFSISL
ncbi:ecto-ADP-ribosyltransferase 4 [Cololabis saira]|uniref:ecto-ADP-ribosyltransferase 4 n=1 Tax=Cololabis saira TaxID=129043 RepID=UPI002AD4B305|nr:ecto-ADP-ribosyltransferase 4 [Cololabis saira]